MNEIPKEQFAFVHCDHVGTENIDSPVYSYWKSVFRDFFKKPSTLVMLGVLAVILLMSFIYPMFAHFDLNDVSNVNNLNDRFISPNAQYWFGTDSNGKSLFDGVWYGARNSILIAFIATFINLFIGVLIGGVWGISKSVDKVMIEVYNVLTNIPYLLIIIILTYALGAGFWNLIFAMCVTGWLDTAHFVRVQILRIRDLEYNLASRTLGTPTFKIIVKNLLPQLVSVIVTAAFQLLPSCISNESFLSFFSLGLPITVPSLGRLISYYSRNVTTNAYLFWIPLSILVLVSLSFYIIGQNLADASDPRTHK